MIYTKSNLKNVLLVGPFGGHNLGDDYIRDCLIKLLSSQRFAVNYTTVNSPRSSNEILLPNLRKFRFGALLNLDKYECIIFAGGQQFQEPRIPNPFYGHLANMFWITFLSTLLKKKVFLLSIGADKKYSIIGRIYIRYILKRACYVSLRDMQSINNLTRFQCKHKQIVFRPDLAFFDCLYRNSKKNKSKNKNLFIIYISLDKKHIKSLNYYFWHLSKLIEVLNSCNIIPTVSLSDVAIGGDFRFYQLWGRYSSSNLKVSIEKYDDLKTRSLVDTIGSYTHVISYRMHPLIAGICAEKYVLPIKTCPKIESLVKLTNSEKCCIDYDENSTTLNLECLLQFIEDPSRIRHNLQEELILYQQEILSLTV